MPNTRLSEFPSRLLLIVASGPQLVNQNIKVHLDWDDEIKYLLLKSLADIDILKLLTYQQNELVYNYTKDSATLVANSGMSVPLRSYIYKYQ